MSTDALKRLGRWLLTAAILVLLVLGARTVNWAASWRALRGASLPLLLAASAVNVVSLMAKGTMWWMFLRPVGVRSLALALRATVAGSALNNLLVANGGEAARVVFVSRASGSPSAAVLAGLLLERFFDILGYILMVVGAAYLLRLPQAIEQWRGVALAVLAALTVLLLLILRWSVRTTAAPSRHTASIARIARIRRSVSRFVRSVASMVTIPRIVAAIMLSMLSWVCQVATYHLTALSVQFPITVAGSTTTVITENLGFLVRATPGNVGVFQLVYAFTAGMLGLSADKGVAVAVLLQALQVVPITILGMLLAPEFVLRRRAPRLDLTPPDGSYRPSFDVPGADVPAAGPTRRARRF
ncbi:MAG TPA: lysylphosphatidylglycerol synthase transmembrane domain-containing protein [Gemmatimonadaceae bacterium]|nr:lysylphosphatidylglycerol synthase transmembrane domain-containing protein [Gemmatimonadaceae bacterium]